MDELKEMIEDMKYNDTQGQMEILYDEEGRNKEYYTMKTEGIKNMIQDQEKDKGKDLTWLDLT